MSLLSSISWHVMIFIGVESSFCLLAHSCSVVVMASSGHDSDDDKESPDVEGIGERRLEFVIWFAL